MRYFTDDGCSYDGMSEVTITSLRTALGKVTTFVTEQEYNDIIEAMRNN